MITMMIDYHHLNDHEVEGEVDHVHKVYQSGYDGNGDVDDDDDDHDHEGEGYVDVSKVYQSDASAIADYDDGSDIPKTMMIMIMQQWP